MSYFACSRVETLTPPVYFQTVIVVRALQSKVEWEKLEVKFRIFQQILGFRATFQTVCELTTKFDLNLGIAICYFK
jgi:hypothetical protein